MCGRYARWSPLEFLVEEFDDIRLPAIPWEPSYNVAPQSIQPVVRIAQDGMPEVAPLRWGLVPFWSKDAKAPFSTFNARCETVATAPAFREAWKNRRCLVPADVFYEWKKLDPKNKQPHAIARADKRPFCFAGLWDSCMSPAGCLETFSILTTSPNELMADLHTRMPVLLAPEDYEAWLSGDVELLKPFPAGRMTAWKVSSAVGNVRNTGADLCAEV